MTHVNAPLTPTGGLRTVLRHLDDGIPEAHVAAAFRVSRFTVTTWATRHLEAGEDGLTDRPFTPVGSSSRTGLEIVARIDTLRRARKWSARSVWHHLLAGGYNNNDAENEKGRGFFHAR